MAFSDDFQKGLGRAARILQLERRAVVETADDPSALTVGLAIVAIGGLLRAGAGVLFDASAFGILAWPAVAVAGSFIGVGIYFLVGLIFRPQGWDFFRLYRALSHAYIVGWASAAAILPFVGFVAPFAILIYALILTVVCVQEVGKLDLGKAIAIVAVPFVMCCGIAAVGGALFGFGVWQFLRNLPIQ